jgi:hypothetical protein
MTRFTAVIAAGALAIGILTGVAGTIVIGNATDGGFAQHHDQMGSMMDMSGAGMEMMSGMMSGSGSMDPGSSLHQGHHPDTER